MSGEVKFIKLVEIDGGTKAMFQRIDRHILGDKASTFLISYKYLAFWARGKDTHPEARIAYEDALMALPKKLQIESVSHWENLTRHYSRKCADYHQSVTYCRAQQNFAGRKAA